MKKFNESTINHALKGIVTLLIFFLCISCIGQNNTNSTLEKEIKTLIENKSDSEGISEEESNIAESIHLFGTSAIPELIKLLKHNDPQVRKRAAFSLSLFDNIDERYLNDLIEALNNGEEWLAPTIAQFGSEKAIRSLIEALKKNTEAESTLSHSFEFLGTKCIPYLIEIIDCKNNCDDDLLNAVSNIFGFLKKDASPAVHFLDSLALSKNNSIDSRKWAIKCLGSIGVYAKEVDKDLILISKNEPEIFASVVMSALIEMKSSFAVELLQNKLDNIKSPFKKVLILRDISEMGQNAIEAGKSILTYLDDDDWDVRVASARALGFIGYKPAIPELVKLLKCESDWRINYVSVKALEMLNAKDAILLLSDIESNHWYSPVREAAKQAILNINNSVQVTTNESDSNFASYFFSYVNIGEYLTNCNLEKDKEQKCLAFGSGFLIGEDNGEWGGSLVFEDSNCHLDTLINDNIKSLYNLNNNIVAIAGLAHMSDNSGLVYQILQLDDKILAKKILTLPGAPLSAQKLKEGELMITTTCGTVILSKDLKLKQANCREL